MPIPSWPGIWTPQMVDMVIVLRAQGFDVHFITRYLTARYGGPREYEVVLRKMQELYFWEKMGIRLGDNG
jgi:hypothetical protein